MAASLPACLAGGAATPASNGDIDLARHLEGAFERVADQTSPSVVVITTKHKAAEPESQGGEDGENGQGQQFEGSPFEFFFRHMPQQHEPNVESQGSGVILRKDGYILTNQHVIDGGGQITVLLKDGTKFTNAVVVGVDDRIDVAVIKVDGKNLPAANSVTATRSRSGNGRSPSARRTNSITVSRSDSSAQKAAAASAAVVAAMPMKITSRPTRRSTLAIRAGRCATSKAASSASTP